MASRLRLPVALSLLAMCTLVWDLPLHAGPVSSTQSRGVAFTLALDKSVYARGELIRFTLTLRNTTSAEAVIEYPTSQPHDVLVLQDGRLVWQWSAGKAFLQVLTRLRLAPGEVRLFEIEWDQKDASGRQVTDGQYAAQARLPVMGESVVTERLPFRIGVQPGPPTPQIISRQTTLAGVSVGEVVANGVVVLRIRESAGGLTVVQRAEIIAARLRMMFEQGLAPPQLRVETVRGEAAIVWRDQLLVTVDANHARLNRTTPLALARIWRQRLVMALSS